MPISPLFNPLPIHDRELIDQIGLAAQELGLGVYLVGGPVRDLLLKQPGTDLDFTVEGDAALLVNTLVARYGGHADFSSTSFFGTSKWRPETHTVIDFARTRRETYAYPGALPTVDPGWAPIADDLFRRDFTINALAINILTGELIDPYGGRADLQHGLIRVLHNQSFRDDPTRLFRAARFGARLQFRTDALTASLIPDALPVIDRLSGERIVNEFERIFAEAEPEVALIRLDTGGVLRHIQADLRADDWLISACRALRFYADSPMPNALSTDYWAILACRVEGIKRLALPNRAIEAINATRRLYLSFEQLTGGEVPSVYVPIFEGCPIFAAWAIAPLATHRAQLEAFDTHWRNVYPTMTGDDLKAMGLRPGPAFRTILHRLRDALLDGEISTPMEERALVQSWIAQSAYL